MNKLDEELTIYIRETDEGWNVDIYDEDVRDIDDNSFDDSIQSISFSDSFTICEVIDITNKKVKELINNNYERN